MCGGTESLVLLVSVVIECRNTLDFVRQKDVFAFLWYVIIPPSKGNRLYANVTTFTEQIITGWILLMLIKRRIGCIRRLMEEYTRD